MNRKAFSKIGIIAGLIVVIMGILIATGVLGSNTRYPSFQTTYNHGYAKFGADFYTYVTNNAYASAVSAYDSAYNLHAIESLLRLALGGGLMAFGIFLICYFGIKKIDASNGKASDEMKPSTNAILPPASETVSFNSTNDGSATTA